MHYCIYRSAKFRGALSAIILSTLCAVAAAQPPAKTTISALLNSGAAVTSAASGVMNRSYLQFVATNPYVLPFATDGVSLREHLEYVAEVLPLTTAGIGWQYNSNIGGPVYSTSDVSLGNYLLGMDVDYRHYAVGLRGDGAGLRLNLLDQVTPLKQRLLEIRELHDTIYKIALKLGVLNSHYPLKLANPQHSTADTDELKDLNKKIVHLDILTGAQPDPNGETPSVADLYVKANLAIKLSVLGGYSSIKTTSVSNSSGTVSNLGINVSGLYQSRRLAFQDHVSALTWLVSVQQQLVTLGPGVQTSVTRYGFSTAWQNMVPLPDRPDDRWTTQIGLELSPPTSLDRTATIDAFLHYRPGKYKKGKANAAKGHVDLENYTPWDFTLFGGLGPDGYGFIGGRMGFAFSL